MPDPYQELDVFGRPKSRVDGVPYVAFDDDLAALQNYVLNLRAKEEAIESGARTPRRVKEIVREGGRLPGYVHPYEPGYVVQEQERLRDETDPVQFLPIVRQGVENVRAIYNEGHEMPEYIDAKLFGQRAPQYLNTLGSQVRKGGPGFEARFGEWQDPLIVGGDPALHGSLTGRTQMWPEKMARSGASLPGDVMSGRIMTGPGLRATDFSDIPGAPNPLAPLIERTQDLAGMAMGGSIPELAARGVDRNALGSGFVPKITKELPPRAANSNAAIPGPVPFPERLYTNYARVIKPEDVLTSEPVWSGAERLSNETGVGYSEAFAQIANEFWRRQGANKYITPELAQAYIKRARSGLTLAADDEVGGAVGASRNALKDLTQGSFGGNVPPSAARNIGRETMPEILARQRASEGYEAAIRDPETKKLYTGMWHEEVLDKIAKDKGVPKDQLPTNLVKGYVNDRGRFLTEEAVERMSQNRSKTAMFRADDEVGAAVAAMHATEGKAPELKVGQANLPAVIPQGGLPAPGTALNPISNRRGFLRGARDLMAAASNANKIVGMAEKLGQPAPIPKNPKVPLKEIWKTEVGEIPEHVYDAATDQAWETMHPEFKETHPELFDKRGNVRKGKETVYGDAQDKFYEQRRKQFEEIEQDYISGYDDYDAPSGTQFSHHQLPGATNYREHLMQMPERTFAETASKKYREYKDFLAKKYGENFEKLETKQEKQERNKLYDEYFQTSQKEQKQNPQFYGDWDEPDIIGHSRVNDRQIPGVGKALHIEEIGSQLHEAGAKHGYKEKGLIKYIIEGNGPWNIRTKSGRFVQNYDSIGKAKADLEGLQSGKVTDRTASNYKEAPDLPFKKTYVDLAVNRMLHEAATQGYNAVSWTPHELQKKNYGGDSNKEILPRIEALAKKYGGKIEKAPVSLSDDFVIHKEGGQYKILRTDGSTVDHKFNTLAEAEKYKNEQAENVHVLKLTPEMKRIFGHEDFSFFPKTGEQKMAQIHKELREREPNIVDIGVNQAFKNHPDLQKRMNEEQEKAGFKLRSDSEAGAAIGALRNSVAPTFYSGLARTIKRAPFETATPSQWMKHLRDTVGARQAEEFEHVGLEGRLGPLAEVKAPVERKAQAALETWKAANKGQRPPKELTDAASNENKRIVEQRLAEKGNEKPLTKAELLAHVAGNQPKFKEIVKGKSDDDVEAAIQRRAQEIINDDMHNIMTDEQYQDRFSLAQEQAADELSAESDRTKYSDYQLPGGTNYREHLMTMPPDWHYPGRKDAPSQAARENTHYSSHWDEPNVIVHTRMNDRILDRPDIQDITRRIAEAVGAKPEHIGSGAPAVAVKKGLITPEEAADWTRTAGAHNEFTGKKGVGTLSLHAEEFQSDLHQEGRKKGYKSNISKADLDREEASIHKALREHEDKNPGFDTFRDAWPGNLRARYDELQKNSGQVPNFPFKKSWPDLAIKRWLREAADNDYDAVSWTPGEAQRDRFQLAHSIENLTYAKHPNGTYTVEGERKNDGGTVKINRGLPVKENELAQHVGEAVAEKIKNNMGQHHELDNVRTLYNTDLKVGGEGLVSFYDKTIKGKVEALVEKFGGKVEKHELNTTPEDKRVREINKELEALTSRINDIGQKERMTDERYKEFTQKSRQRQILVAERMKLETEAGRTLGQDAGGNFVWSVKLTPEMKRAIRSEGFPLFTAGPVMTPVDHDPFDKKQKPKPKLEPVEHDPFAQPTPDLGGTLNKLISTAGGYRPRPRPIQNGFGRRQ